MDAARPATGAPRADREERHERHRRRFRALVVEMRRMYIIQLKAFDRYLAEEDADDAGGVAIVPGDGSNLPRSGNRPPANLHR